MNSITMHLSDLKREQAMDSSVPESLVVEMSDGVVIDTYLLDDDDDDPINIIRIDFDALDENCCPLCGESLNPDTQCIECDVDWS